MTKHSKRRSLKHYNTYTYPAMRMPIVIMANRKLASILLQAARDEHVSVSRLANELLCSAFDIVGKDR